QGIISRATSMYVVGWSPGIRANIQAGTPKQGTHALPATPSPPTSEGHGRSLNTRSIPQTRLLAKASFSDKGPGAIPAIRHTWSSGLLRATSHVPPSVEDLVHLRSTRLACS